VSKRFVGLTTCIGRFIRKVISHFQPSPGLLQPSKITVRVRQATVRFLSKTGEEWYPRWGWVLRRMKNRTTRIDDAHLRDSYITREKNPPLSGKDRREWIVGC